MKIFERRNIIRCRLHHYTSELINTESWTKELDVGVAPLCPASQSSPWFWINAIVLVLLRWKVEYSAPYFMFSLISIWLQKEKEQGLYKMDPEAISDLFWLMSPFCEVNSQ